MFCSQGKTAELLQDLTRTSQSPWWNFVSFGCIFILVCTPPWRQCHRQLWALVDFCNLSGAFLQVQLPVQRDSTWKSPRAQVVSMSSQQTLAPPATSPAHLHLTLTRPPSPDTEPSTLPSASPDTSWSPQSPIVQTVSTPPLASILCVLPDPRTLSQI